MNRSELTEKLDTSFTNLTSFFREIASLLRDCDRLMGEKGYITFNGNTVAYEQSTSLTKPDSWFPAYLNRMYYPEEREKEKLDCLLFISVFLRYGSVCCRTIPTYMVDNVPLIVAGIIVPNTLPRSFKSDIVYVTKAWFWAKESKDNILDENISEVKTIYPKKGEYEDSRLIRTFACPLEEIKGTEDLRTKVIEKLLKVAEDLQK